jgi:hypothetical protein
MRGAQRGRDGSEDSRCGGLESETLGDTWRTPVDAAVVAQGQ